MLRYSKDELGKDILIDSYNRQVMMEWEKPYMEHCINKLFPHGDVLEIGFGMGYSASHIQRFPIRSHTIIEYDPVVVKKARDWANQQSNPVNIIHGTWQDTLPLLGTFDGIFHDDHPLIENADDYTYSFKTFFDIIRNFHIREQTRMVWYCEHPIDEQLVDWFKSHNSEYIITPFSIKKPSNLRYATGYKDTMFVPELIIYK